VLAGGGGDVDGVDVCAGAELLERGEGLVAAVLRCVLGGALRGAAVRRAGVSQSAWVGASGEQAAWLARQAGARDL